MSDILELVGAGASFDEVLEDYPYLEREDILAAIQYAALQTDHPILRSALASSSTISYRLPLHVSSRLSYSGGCGVKYGDGSIVAIARLNSVDSTANSDASD